MPDKPATERTEQPTPKKLSEARSKGQSPRSEELMSFASILSLLLATVFLAPALMGWFTTILRQGLSSQTDVFADGKVFIHFINTKISDIIIMLCPFFAVLFAGSVFAGAVGSGLNFAPKAIRLKWSAINPVSGLSNLMNARSMMRFLTSVLKLFFVSLIVWSYLHDKTEMLATIRWAWSMQILAAIAKLTAGLVIRVCIALLVIGAADVLYQKWKFIQDLKMTRQEVKEERKQTDGSPEVKSRIRRIQFQMALKRVLQEVPKASVVLVNPTHVAVALRYETKTMEAPVLVAKGADHLSEKIREIARAYGVPIIRRPELARTIYATVEPGNAIPESLYVAVAEVLALIYRLRHRK